MGTTVREGACLRSSVLQHHLMQPPHLAIFHDTSLEGRYRAQDPDQVVVSAGKAEEWGAHGG